MYELSIGQNLRHLVSELDCEGVSSRSLFTAPTWKGAGADSPVPLISRHAFLFKIHCNPAVQCLQSPWNLSRPLFPNLASYFRYPRNVCVSVYLCALPPPPSTTASKARRVLFAVSIAAACNDTQNTSGVQWMKRKMGILCASFLPGIMCLPVSSHPSSPSSVSSLLGSLNSVQGS